MIRVTTVGWTGLRDVYVSHLCKPPLKRSISQLSKGISETNPPFQLLGPPEIYQSDYALKQSPTSKEGTVADCMNSDLNNTRFPPESCLGLTENCSPTYLTSGNPCLDFFFHVVPDTPSEKLTQRLQLAWDHDPLTALKLICNLRGIRGTGKSDKEGFYTSALWLHKSHPKTLACNVSSFAKFGYFKDLLEILRLLLEGPDYQKPTKQIKIRYKATLQGRKKKPTAPREERIMVEKARVKLVMEKARELRMEKTFAMAQRAVNAYNNDPVYRFLYDQISNLFAQLLKPDLQYLNSGKLRKISLASKWCPSLFSSFDKSTLICESIAKRIFPRDSYPEYEGIEEAHYSYRIRDRLRKQVLTPLRKALKLPEIYMAATTS